jgi:hypothetical protein
MPILRSCGILRGNSRACEVFEATAIAPKQMHRLQKFGTDQVPLLTIRYSAFQAGC